MGCRAIKAIMGSASALRTQGQLPWGEKVTFELSSERWVVISWRVKENIMWESLEGRRSTTFEELKENWSTAWETWDGTGEVDKLSAFIPGILKNKRGLFNEYLGKAQNLENIPLVTGDTIRFKMKKGNVLDKTMDSSLQSPSPDVFWFFSIPNMHNI